MTTGQKIYEARRKAGMTQEALASLLGVSRQSVSKWESDNAFPETEKLIELCKLFSLSADELLLGIVKREEATLPEEETVAEQPAPEVQEKPAGNAAETEGKTIDLARFLKIASGACAMAVVLFSLIFVFFVGTKLTLRGIGVDGAVNADLKLYDIYQFFGSYYRRIPEILGKDSSNAFTNANFILFGMVMTALCCFALISVTVFAVLSAVRFVKQLLGKTEKSITPFVLACYFTFLGFALSFNALSYRRMHDFGTLVKTILNEATIAGIILGAVFLVAYLVLSFIHNAKSIKRDISAGKILSYSATPVLFAAFCVLTCSGMFGINSEYDGLIISRPQFGAFYIFQTIASRGKTGADSDTTLSTLICADLLLFFTIATFLALCTLLLLQTARIICNKRRKEKAEIVLSSFCFALSIAYAILSWGTVKLLWSGSNATFSIDVTIPVVVVALSFTQLLLTIFSFRVNNKFSFTKERLKSILLQTFGMLSVLFSLIFVFFLGSNWSIGGIITNQSAEEFHIRLAGYDAQYFFGNYFTDLQHKLSSFGGGDGSPYTFNSYCATNLHLFGIIMAVLGGATMLAVCILAILATVRFLLGILGKTNKPLTPLITAVYFTYLGGALLWNAMLQTNFSVSGSVNGSSLLQFNAPTLAGLILGFVFWAAHMVFSALQGKEKKTRADLAWQIVPCSLIATLIVFLCLIGSYGAFTFFGFSESWEEENYFAHMGLGPLQLIYQVAHIFRRDYTLETAAISPVISGYLAVCFMVALTVLSVLQICKLTKNMSGGRHISMSYPICLLVITCIYALGCHAYTWIECTELGMNADILQYTSYPSLIVPMVLILLATANLVTTCIFRKRQKKNKGKTEDTQEVVSE